MSLQQTDELTVTLTVQEAKALRNCARLLYEVMREECGDFEPACLRGVAKIEVELFLAGVEE